MRRGLCRQARRVAHQLQSAADMKCDNYCMRKVLRHTAITIGNKFWGQSLTGAHGQFQGRILMGTLLQREFRAHTIAGAGRCIRTTACPPRAVARAAARSSARIELVTTAAYTSQGIQEFLGHFKPSIPKGFSQRFSALCAE